MLKINISQAYANYNNTYNLSITSGNNQTILTDSWNRATGSLDDSSETRNKTVSSVYKDIGDISYKADIYGRNVAKSMGLGNGYQVVIVITLTDTTNSINISRTFAFQHKDYSGSLSSENILFKPNKLKV